MTAPDRTIVATARDLERLFEDASRRLARGRTGILLVGAPGSGKTMLARRLATLVPLPERDDAAALVELYAASGLRIPLRPPFRAPHHTISAVAMFGGGSPVRPGELSLAHTGTLFLEEAPEFARSMLKETARILDKGEVRLARAGKAVLFPAAPRLLVLGTTPCPCGYALGGSARLRCACTPERIQHYVGRLEPIMRHVDESYHLALDGSGREWLRGTEPWSASA